MDLISNMMVMELKMTNFPLFVDAWNKEKEMNFTNLNQQDTEEKL